MSEEFKSEKGEVVDDNGDDKWSRSWDWGWHGSSSWIWGVLLIFFGTILLLQTFFPDLRIVNAGNWWVIFILVPGINMIGRGWKVYRRTGRFWGPLLWGILLVGFGLSQLFDAIGGQYIWPVLFILGGITLLFGGKR